jgi:hypothetical protein
MHEHMVQLSLILGIVNFVIAITLGISNIQQRNKEPGEKRWKLNDERWSLYEEWKREMEKEFTRDNNKKWNDNLRWSLTVDDKLARDYEAINDLRKTNAHILKFERVMLKSMEAILSHLKTGNETNKIQETLDDVKGFMLDEFHSE